MVAPAPWSTDKHHRYSTVITSAIAPYYPGPWFAPGETSPHVRSDHDRSGSMVDLQTPQGVGRNPGLGTVAGDRRWRTCLASVARAHPTVRCGCLRCLGIGCPRTPFGQVWMRAHI